MTEALLKRYPKSVDKKGRKEYAIKYGQEAYLEKEPKRVLEMRRVNEEKNN